MKHLQGIELHGMKVKDVIKLISHVKVVDTLQINCG